MHRRSRRSASALLVVLGVITAIMSVVATEIIWMPAGRQLKAENLRSNELEARHDQISRLSLLKRSIATEVIVGRRDLIDAARFYRSLHRNDRDAELFRLQYHDSSDWRCMCHNVQAFVEVVMIEHAPQNLTAVRERLAPDLARCLHAGEADRR